MFGRKGDGGRRGDRDGGRRPASGRPARTTPADLAPVDPATLADVEATGPYDEADAPDDQVTRVDLGALLVPVFEGLEMRLEVDPTGQVVGVTLDDGRGTLQLAAFAAPKSKGIWTELRADLTKTVRDGGGTVTQAEGAYGPELVAQVPTDRRGVLAPARFLGIDGPRWFLQVVLAGEAGVPHGELGLLDDVLRRVVVVRGGEAMPMRDPLPLRLPKEAMDAAGMGETADLDPLTRGPEITEVR